MLIKFYGVAPICIALDFNKVNHVVYCINTLFCTAQSQMLFSSGAVPLPHIECDPFV